MTPADLLFAFVVGAAALLVLFFAVLLFLAGVVIAATGYDQARPTRGGRAVTWLVRFAFFAWFAVLVGLLVLERFGAIP